MAKRVAMDLSEYHTDLAEASRKGKIEVIADFIYILKSAKTDKEEAFFKLREICPVKEQRVEIMNLLGLEEV